MFHLFIYQSKPFHSQKGIKHQKSTKLRRLFTADRNDPASLLKVPQEILKNCDLLFPVKRKLSSVKIRMY